MTTKERQYTKNDSGYNAAVADFTAMFDWDTIEPSTDNLYTDFKKACGDTEYIGLRIVKSSVSSSAVTVKALSNNGQNTCLSNNDAPIVYMSYAYGNGFFAFCGCDSELPSTKTNYLVGGISTCRNIHTGENSWCSFSNATLKANYTNVQDYFLLSKNDSAARYTTWRINPNANVGAAVSLHNVYTGWVSDKVMMLTATPDDITCGLLPVIFNGVSYIRMGLLLIPNE